MLTHLKYLKEKKNNLVIYDKKHTHTGTPPPPHRHHHHPFTHVPNINHPLTTSEIMYMTISIRVFTLTSEASYYIPIPCPTPNVERSEHR